MKTAHAYLAMMPQKLAALAAVLAIVAGAMVLAGWAFEITVLKSILPGWVAMKANTAVSFILTGIALLLTARSPATFNPERSGRSFSYGNRTAYPLRVQLSTFIFRFARLCGLLVGLIGLLTLGEYVFGWNPGLDQWLFHEPAGAVGTTDPGRMAPETALSFVLLAAALWIAGGSRKTRWTILASSSLGLIVTALALAAMLSYLTPDLGNHGWFGLTIMAMHTAILFYMLGMAVIAISWRQDILPWSLGNSTTAAFALGMLLLVLIGFNINRSQFRLAEVDRKIAYNQEVLGNTRSLLINVISAQTHARGYVITGDKRFKIRYLDTRADSNVRLDTLRKPAGDTQHNQQHFSKIETQVTAQLNWLQQAIDTERTTTSNATRSNMLRHGDALLENLLVTFNQIEHEHWQIIGELGQESERIEQLSYIIILSGMLASLLIFLTAIFRLNFAVNERRRAEEALRKSTDLLLYIVETVPNRIFWKDRDLRYLGCNMQFAKDAGCSSPDELMGKTDYELAWKNQAELYRADDKAVMESGIPRLNYEEPQTTPDGSTIWLRTSKVPLRNEYNQVIGILGTYQDITEWKRTEDSLRKLTQAVEQSPSAIVITDLDANIEYVNDGFIKVTGYSLAEVVGRNPRILQSGKTPKESYQDMWAHLKRGEVWKGEFINRRKDGSEYIESVLISPVRQADAKVTSYLAIKEDVTEFKLAQEALRASRENLHRLLNSMAEGAYGVDLNGDCTFVNRAFLQLLGYQDENEVLGKHIHEYIHHSHADGSQYPEIECNVYRAYRNNQSSHVSDEVFWRKDGIAIPVEFWAQPIVSDGLVTGAIVTFTNITLRKKAEESLRESEEKFSKMFEVNPAMVAIGTLDGKIVDVNLSYANFLGYSRKEMLGKSLADLGVISAEELQRLLELGQRAGTPMRNVEVSLRARGGNLLNGLLSADIISLGGVSYRLATLLDITERKRAEETLQASLEEFRILSEAMPQIVWITRADGWCIYINRHWIDYTGLTMDESLGHGWNKPFHPDDQQRAWDAWQQAVATAGMYSVESRLRRADGVYRWWLIRGVPLQDANGKILKWFGTCTDIHDMKMAELEISRTNQVLRESERRFTDLLENVEMISVMLDREARITYCNEYLLRLTGWTHDEVIGKNWFKFFVPSELTDLSGPFFAALLSDVPEAWHYVNEILTRSGERRLIRWNNSVLRSADGDVIGTASIGEDITASQQAESKLAEQLEELRRWHDVTSGREERILDLKHEVNELLGQTGKHPRYLSAASQDPMKEKS